ncbi:hypothetical protein [Mangrovibacter phragmitis]|uniref:hypothetical protein n=1 Tax=Mangrovibacter phragmitis TaxID=1691903 RepID=UPI00336A6CC0
MPVARESPGPVLKVMLSWALYAFICGPGSLVMCVWLTLTLASPFSLPQVLLTRAEYLVQGVSRGEVRHCTDWHLDGDLPWYRMGLPRPEEYSPPDEVKPLVVMAHPRFYRTVPPCEKARESHNSWVRDTEKALMAAYVVLVAISVLMRLMAHTLIFPGRKS